MLSQGETETEECRLAQKRSIIPPHVIAVRVTPTLRFVPKSQGGREALPNKCNDWADLFLVLFITSFSENKLMSHLEIASTDNACRAFDYTRSSRYRKYVYIIAKPAAALFAFSLFKQRLLNTQYN